MSLLDSPAVDLERLIATLAPEDVLHPAPAEIVELAYDTRAVTQGTLFFCVRGDRVDRHDLAVEAVDAGAVALVVERPLDLDVPQLVVPDARPAMAVAAAEFFGHPSRELTVPVRNVGAGVVLMSVSVPVLSPYRPCLTLQPVG